MRVELTLCMSFCISHCVKSTMSVCISELKFEEMIDKLEKSSGQTVVTLHEARLLLRRQDELAVLVYDYWLNKRLHTVRIVMVHIPYTYTHNHVPPTIYHHHQYIIYLYYNAQNWWVCMFEQELSLQFIY